LAYLYLDSELADKKVTTPKNIKANGPSCFCVVRFVCLCLTVMPLSHTDIYLMALNRGKFITVYSHYTFFASEQKLG